MEAFKNFMTDVKFALPNWSWIAIALVVAAVIIIIVCTVIAGRKKKQGHSAEKISAEQPAEEQNSAVENAGASDGYDKLIEPFYPVPENAVINEGPIVEAEEIPAPAEEVSDRPAEEIEYRSEQVSAPEQVDEVTYSAVVTPVEETAEKPAKKPAPKKTGTAKKTTAKKPTAKSTAKKTTAKKPAVKKTEAKTVKLVKEEEAIKEPAEKPAKKTTAKKPAVKKTETKTAKPKAKSDSIPKVSSVLTEDIPEPVRTEPEVAPVKPKAKQTVLKAEDKNEAPAKAEAKKPAPKKPAVKKTEAKPAKKPAPKKSAEDVAQKVAKATPKGPEKVYHVSRRPQDNKWEVRLEGSSKAMKLFRTKAEAMDYAIPLAGDDSDNSRVVIHKADGRPKNIAFL